MLLQEKEEKEEEVVVVVVVGQHHHNHHHQNNSNTKPLRASGGKNVAPRQPLIALSQCRDLPAARLSSGDPKALVVVWTNPGNQSGID